MGLILILVFAFVNGEKLEFLLDTGASYVTLKSIGDAPKIGRVGARLADNSIKIMNIHLIENFSIGDCELGPIEVLHGERNLLGMNALGSSFSVINKELFIDCVNTYETD